MICGELTNNASQLKLDVMGQWIETEWLPNHPDQDLVTLWIPSSCIDELVTQRFNPDFDLEGSYRYSGYSPVDCPVVTRVTTYTSEAQITHRTGAYLYHFAPTENGENVDVLVMGAHYTNDGWNLVCVAAVPRAFIPAWTAFSNECTRLASALMPTEKVVIIGGRTASFVPTTDWEEVILPPKLKEDLMDDVSSFFRKGIDIYKRLNLKPFRKLLLAGVPGTGKTMLCSALAKWAIEQGYLVIYVSSAYRNPNDHYGSTFGKIQHALAVATASSHPTLILLEELDAYLHEEEKALVLNVLDGSESSMNDQGTLLIATTNYPEAIDERILKRPGRLDRIFIIPETRAHNDAEKMLKQYLGAMWKDEHTRLVPRLIGYPGAFIREVAVYALTQVAYDDLEDLPVELLEDSFKRLKDQIEARDDFLTTRRSATLGLTPVHPNGN